MERAKGFEILDSHIRQNANPGEAHYHIKLLEIVGLLMLSVRFENRQIVIATGEIFRYF